MHIDSTKKQSNLNLIVTQSFVFFIVLQQSGLAFDSAAKLSLSFLVQVFVGLSATLVFLPTVKQSVEAQIGIAFIFGSVALVTGSVLDDVINWWVLFVIGSLLVFNKKNILNLRKWANDRERTLNDFCIVNLLVITFLGGIRKEVYLVSLLLVLHKLLIKQYRNTDTQLGKFITSTPVYLGYLSSSFWLMNLFASEQPFVSKLLSPLHMGSDDQIYSEVMSNSLNKNGLTSNMAAIGSEINYHWFSFAWSGALSELTNSPPFAVTLHAVPLFCVFTTALLIVSVSGYISSSRNAAILSICILLFGNSLPAFNNIPYYFVLSTSNIFSIVVFLVASIIFIEVVETWTPQIVFFLIATSIILTISKAPYMVVFNSGIFLCVFGIKDKRILRRLVGLTAVLFSVFVVCYFWFFQASWFNAKYTLSPSFVNAGGSIAIVPTLGVIFFVCSRLSILHSAVIMVQNRWNVAVIFTVGVSISSLAAFFVDGKSSESHLLAPALTISAPLIANTLVLLWKRLSAHRNSLIAVFALTFVIGGFFLIDINQLIRNHRLDLSQSDFVQLIHPGLSAIVALLVCVLVFRSIRTNFVKFAMVLGFSVSSFLGYLTHSSLITQSIGRSDIATKDEIEIFEWIGLNTSSDSVLATNRFLCRNELNCSYDDSSQLLAAISRRSLFIEGPRFVSGGHPYAAWINERIELSLDFADNPTVKKSEILRNLKIDFFLLDERFTTARCASFKNVIRTSGGLCLIEI